jgi:predicted Zn-dependent protease
MSRTLRTLLLLLAAALVLSACGSLGGLDVLGAAVRMSQGKGEEPQAERSTGEKVIDTARALQKGFEDITPEQEYYIGRAVAATILGRYSPYAEAAANGYLNLLGQSLAMASDRPETFGGYHFLVLDSEEINAFAAPGGLIFVSRGLLRCADSEDTVAAILAHEIGHVVRKHGLQAIKTSRITAALTSAAITAAETAGPEELAKLTSVFEDSIGDITSTLINSGYSRAAEREADLEAVAILQRVGYDPNALVRMLEVMKTRLKPGGLDFAKTHPDPQDRIAEIRKVLPASGPYPVVPQRQGRFQAALGKI